MLKLYLYISTYRHNKTEHIKSIIAKIESRKREECHGSISQRVKERASGGMYPQHGADTKESHKGFAHCAAYRRQKLSGFVAPLPPRPTKAKR
jgi:hypothetical protein